MWRRIQMTIQWEQVREYKEIIYEKYNGIAKVTMNRPEKHNAFTPLTVNEMIDAFPDERDNASIAFIILTVAVKKAFSSVGNHSVRVIVVMLEMTMYQGSMCLIYKD